MALQQLFRYIIIVTAIIMYHIQAADTYEHQFTYLQCRQKRKINNIKDTFRFKFYCFNYDRNWLVRDIQFCFYSIFELCVKNIFALESFLLPQCSGKKPVAKNDKISCYNISCQNIKVALSQKAMLTFELYLLTFLNLPIHLVILELVPIFGIHHAY